MQMDESIRWTVKVSKETDATLRSYLAQSGVRKGDISKFIEEAVRWRVLDRTAAGIRRRLEEINPDKLQTLIDDAVTKVRAERTSSRRRSKASRASKAARSARRTRR